MEASKGSETWFPLTRIAADEEKHLADSTRQLGSLWSCAEAVANLYGRLADAIESGCPSEPSESYARAYAACLFLRAAQRTALLQVLDVARRHFSESHGRHRRASDLMAFAWISWRDIEEADKWMMSRRNWDAYEKAYSTTRIREALRQLNDPLALRHKELGRRVHPSRTSLGTSIRFVESPYGLMPRIDMFDTRPDEGGPFGPEVKAELLLDAALWHLEAQRSFQLKALKSRSWRAARISFEAAITVSYGALVHEENAWADRIKRLNSWRAEQRHDRHA